MVISKAVWKYCGHMRSVHGSSFYGCSSVTVGIDIGHFHLTGILKCGDVYLVGEVVKYVFLSEFVD